MKVTPPEGLSYLPYQEQGIVFGTLRNKILLADEMGLGKTVQALGMLNEKKWVKSALIVCPKSPLLNWKAEAEKWLTRPLDLTFINYDVLKKLDMSRVYDVVIFDESHYMKNPEAQRTVLALQIRARNQIFMTGTPILNRPIELFPFFQFVDPDGWGRSRHLFALRFCGAFRRQVTRSKCVWDYRGVANQAELRKILKKYMLRRLKKDVFPELPDRRRQLVLLDVNKSLIRRERYICMKKGLDYTSENAEALEQVTLSFSEMAEARRLLGEAKVAPSVEILKNALESPGKIIVFAHHKSVIDGLEKGLAEYSPLTITGQTSAKRRHEVVTMFQQGSGYQVIIGNIKAMGVSLTLTAADRVFFVESDWTPGLLDQAEMRADRIGQKNAVNVYYLCADKSLDANLCQMYIKKKETIGGIIRG